MSVVEFWIFLFLGYFNMTELILLSFPQNSQKNSQIKLQKMAYMEFSN
jgi:hypothetical protein